MKTLKRKTQNDSENVDIFYNNYLSSQEENSFNKISALDTGKDYSESNDTLFYTFDVRTRLEEFTEGDTEFIGEFANYIFQNMKMLEDELPRNYCARDSDQFSRMLHMVKPTIEMLGDHDFINYLTIMSQEWKKGVFIRSKVKTAMRKAIFYQTKLIEISNLPYKIKYAS